MKVFNVSGLVVCFAALTGLAGCSAEAQDDSAAQDTAAVRKTDLTRDVAAGGGARGTPFLRVAAKPVSSSLASSLKSLVERCIDYRESPTVLLKTTSACPAEIRDIVTSESRITERATLRIGNENYTVVYWDADRSDGGDMQDLGVYDARGNRLGVYRDFFARNNSILDVVAGIFGQNVRVVELSANQYAEGVLRGAVADVASVCAKHGQDGDCTFATALYAPSETQWSAFQLAQGLSPLADAQAIKASIKECLFDTFAYTHYSEGRQKLLATKFLESVSARSSTADFFRVERNWSYPAFDSVRTDIDTTASVGGPECALLIKERHSPLFVSLSSDVQD